MALDFGVLHMESQSGYGHLGPARAVTLFDRRSDVRLCTSTKLCPEHIHITDNAIIPLKERVVDRFYDPVSRLLRMVTGG